MRRSRSSSTPRSRARTALQFHNEVLPELKERYIAPGKVRLIYRDFPLDQTALAAAALAHCAAPERYFSMLDVLFETQSNWARADDPIAA